MYPTKRRVELAFIEAGTTSVKLPRGILELNAIISLAYSVNVTAVGTAVRPRGVPIRRLQLVADGGKVVHSIKPVTAIRFAEVYEQTGLANLVTPVSGVGLGAQTGNCDIPLFFAQPFSLDKHITALPTWAYDELTLVVDWGNITDVMTGAATGPVTAVESYVTLNGVTDIKNAGNGRELAQSLGVSVTSFREVASTAANASFAIDLPRSADIRAVLIEVDDSTGEGTNAGLNALTLLENNVVRVFSAVKGRTLRGDNSKVFGLLNGTPTGLYIVEFAEDQDITDIYAATEKDSAQLLLDIAAGTYTVRVTTLGIEPPKRVA